MNNEEKILDLLGKIIDEQAKTNERLDRMEGRMDSMEGRMDRMEDRLLRVEMTQENKVLPALKLLAEGHTQLSDQIKRLSVVDALQQDVAVLKSAVSYLTQEVNNLKKAQ